LGLKRLQLGMEVWAHTLVKNEARWLWYSVSSVVDHVDKVLLWDTGSTDGSYEVEKELERRYPGKIILKQRNQKTVEDFTKVRQEMLDATKSDWFLMLDGDEIWWEGTIRHLLSEIHKNGNSIESIIVPTINLVGDIFHFQEKSAGRYRFGNRVGHYNLRAINRNILGLHSQGIHGVWGWADGNGTMIQERDPKKVRFVDVPYLHATFLERSSSLEADSQVVKRSKKLKYELGESFPKDYYYPEVFFKDRPEFILNPWEAMSTQFKLRSFFETPLKKIKRKLWQGKVGY
jgi:glycosyltransferase involved in cell wall biosynthesis